jgi:hypothetical protein
MLHKIATAGVVAAVIVGAGTTALAVTGDQQTTAGRATGSGRIKPAHSAHQGKGQVLRKALRRVEHAVVVTKGKDGYIEHDAIRGRVSSVSASSISVTATDGYTRTFAVVQATHVRKRSESGGKVTGAPAKIADVRSGDEVGVLGRRPASSTGNPVATVVVDGIRKR